MNLSEYLKYILKDSLIHKWTWCISLLGDQLDNKTNDYIKIVDDKGYVNIDGEWVEYKEFIPGRAFIRISDPVDIPTGVLACVHSDIKTTMGRFLVNYLLIEVPFKGKLDYIQGDLNLGSLIKQVKHSLSEGIITVEEYKDFVWSCTYLESFNKLVTPSSTAKLLVPPPGLSAFKKKLKLDLATKHGDDWASTPSLIVEYDSSLKEFYSEYIKDDPSNDIIANKKNKSNALAKKYLTFSATNAFGEQVHIDESLDDGYPTDPTKLAAMYNTIRSASHARGSETQKGGGVAKSVLRATSSIVVGVDDCKVKYGANLMVTTDNADNLLGRYILVNGKVVGLTQEIIANNMSKVVELRTPRYCKAEGTMLCKVCVGDKAGAHANGITLIVTNVSSVLTTSSLKAMHNSQISTVKISLDDVMS